MSIKDRIDEELDRLRAMRDELDVQAHLAKADASDEIHEVWQKAEHARAKLDAEFDRIKSGMEGPLESVGEAADLLVDELKKSYQRIRDLI